MIVATSKFTATYEEPYASHFPQTEAHHKMMRMLTMSHASGSSPASTPSQGDSPPGTDAASAAGTATSKGGQADRGARPSASEMAGGTAGALARGSAALAKSAPIGREAEWVQQRSGATEREAGGSSVGQASAPRKIPAEQVPLGFSPGPQPDSWEAIATSWILPDVAHVLWRAVLLAVTVGVFVGGMKARPVSVSGFSVDAYVMSIITAGMLLLPCVVAFAWNDGRILDSDSSKWVWSACATMLLFTSALATVSWVGYATYTPGRFSHGVSEGHWVLSVLMQVEFALNAIRLTVAHMVAACSMVGIYIGLVRARVCGPPWLLSLLVQSRLSFVKVCVAFLASVTVMFLLVRARTTLTDSLERHREQLGVVEVRKSEPLQEVTAR